MRSASLATLLLLGACTSQTMERDQMGIWKSSDQIKRETTVEVKQPEAEAPPEVDKGVKVTIPEEAKTQSEEFANRKSTIFSDAVDVDLSRDGWLSLASFAMSRDAVIRRDEEDAQRGVLTITLQRIPNVAATADAVPTVRFGGGLRIVGIDRITLRFWAKKSVEKPEWFHALAAGKKAVYVIETDPPKDWSGRIVEVRSELHRVGDTYRFDWSAEGKP